jgi:uncharacterized protein
MTSFRSFVHRFAFVIYYLLAFVIAFGVQETMMKLVAAEGHDPAKIFYPEMWHWMAAHHRYINIPNIVAFGIGAHVPAIVIMFLYGGAPTISAFVVSWAGWGRDGVVRLLSRFIPWREGVRPTAALRIYAVIFAAYFAGALLYFRLDAVIPGHPHELDEVLSILGGSPLAIIATLFIGTFIDDGGTPEEPGWRGFAMPLLQERLRTPLVAAVVLALFWASWHLPLTIPTLLAPGVDWIGFWYREAQFYVLSIGLSIIMAYCCNLCGGSVIPAIIIHAGSNVWGKACENDVFANMWVGTGHQAGLDPRTGIVFAVAIVVVIVADPELGWRRRGAPPEFAR